MGWEQEKEEPGSVENYAKCQNFSKDSVLDGGKLHSGIPTSGASHTALIQALPTPSEQEAQAESMGECQLSTHCSEDTADLRHCALFCFSVIKWLFFGTRILRI
ncbi:hypothetical protein UY3_02146 [Chelonia mydas]|uniref:Uncharacterized protein n=1 Tax=Chelonia mydas TaxID=8469 RepID=M7BTU8_CHEMY|nr:hypothetical protein UY3_02146 [Chelonia mydas]